MKTLAGNLKYLKYDYIAIIDYLHFSFHGNFVEPEDVGWKRQKRDTIGQPHLTPQKLSRIYLDVTN